MERRLRQTPEGRAVSCPFSLPLIGNTVPLFLRESVWLPSERWLAGGQQVQGQVGREEQRAGPGDRDDPFVVRQPAAGRRGLGALFRRRPRSAQERGPETRVQVQPGATPKPGGQDASTLRDVRGSRVSGHYCCALGSFPWLAGLEA